MTRLTVNPDQVVRKLFLIAFIHVLLVQKNMHDDYEELGLVVTCTSWNCLHKNVQGKKCLSLFLAVCC